MNLYFGLFVLCALMSMPVGAQIHIRIQNGIHYRIRLRAAGMPVLRKTKQEEPSQDVSLKPASMLKGIRQWDGALFGKLMRQGHLGRLLRLFEWRNVEVRFRLSFADAAQTAMAYALLRTIFQTVACIRPFSLSGGVEMDFRGEGSMLSLRCIAQAKLGKLLAAWICLGLAVLRHRAAQARAEEEQYAAASH